MAQLPTEVEQEVAAGPVVGTVAFYMTHKDGYKEAAIPKKRTASSTPKNDMAVKSSRSPCRGCRGIDRFVAVLKQ